MPQRGLADIVKDLLKRSQMSLGSAYIASVIIFLKSGLRLRGFMPGAAKHAGIRRVHIGNVHLLGNDYN